MCPLVRTVTPLIIMCVPCASVCVCVCVLVLCVIDCPSNRHWGGVGCPLLDASGAIFLGGFNFEVMKIVDGGLWSNFRTQSPVMSCPAITRTGVLVFGSDNSVYGLIGE